MNEFEQFPVCSCCANTGCVGDYTLGLSLMCALCSVRTSTERARTWRGGGGKPTRTRCLGTDLTTCSSLQTSSSSQSCVVFSCFPTLQHFRNHPKTSQPSKSRGQPWSYLIPCPLTNLSGTQQHLWRVLLPSDECRRGLTSRSMFALGASEASQKGM